MVSDAFFPFRDGVDVGIKEGISAIVQPGGSERDFDSISACNEANPQVTMVFTKQRAFKH
jgi:phosphoribosylaminoimidazolecarboxamide formyltransferase/IMP cyclohydrolase